MSSSSFASLHAGMLVRKGAAAPSLEPTHRPWSAVAAAVDAAAKATPRAPERQAPSAPAISPRPRPEPVPALPKAEDEDVCVEIAAAPQGGPSQCEAPQSDAAARPAVRAGVRLTHEQARVMKLAALLLDRPQQELLAAGLELRLESLACGPLSHCACFRAAAEKIAKR